MAGVVAQQLEVVEASVEADGAVVHDAALGLEQKQVIQIVGSIEVADLAGCQRPLFERGLAVQPAMGMVMVFAFEVGPQTTASELRGWRSRWA